MNTIKISDVTMKQVTEQIALSFKEKIELAKLLDKLGTSVIELEGVGQSRVDALRVKSISAAVKNSIIAVPVELDASSVQRTFSALSEAKHPRLQVCASVSPVQMEYLHHKKPEAMLSAIRETAVSCCALCKDVEFVANDATRSDPAFLAQVISAVLEAGVTTVTVCEAAGSMLPQEFAEFIRNLYEAVPSLKNVTLGVSCADTLSMADACTIAAVTQGAGEIKAAAYPVSTASLANVARILHAKAPTFQATCSIQVTQLSRIMGQIAWMCQSGAKKASPFESDIRDDNSGIFLTVHDDAAAVAKIVERLGYDLSEEDTSKVYEAFVSIAEKKEKVSARELEAIVASAAMQVPSTYVLESYVITAGNTISSTAHMKLTKNGEPLEGVCLGGGPIDASFLAIEQITGCHYELDDFEIQAITEGSEAMGQTVVKLRSNGKLYSGKGISIDIVGASIAAYLSALNKIAYEEAEV